MIGKAGVILLLTFALIELKCDSKIFSLLFVALLTQIKILIMDQKEIETKSEEDILDDFIKSIKSYKKKNKESPLKISVSFNLLELVLRNKELESEILVNETEDVFISDSRLALNLNLEDYNYVIIPRGKRC